MLLGIDASRAVTNQRTGTEAYAYSLIQALISLTAEKGHQLRLYYNQPPPPNLFPAASHVHDIVIPYPRLWTHLRLAWELQLHPPDCFFTPAHVIPLTYFGKSAATIHDLGYHYFPEAHTRRQVAYLEWSTRHNGRRAEQIIADSQVTKDDLIKFYNLNPNKIEVVYPACDPALKPVTDKEQLTAVQQKYGIIAPYLLYIGTLQPRKNLVRLVEAYAAMPDHSHQLVLAGRTGWLAEPILKAIDALEPTVRRKIILPGYIEDGDKAALIYGADVMLFPSLYEGFGFPVLEANACGTAVICSNTSSLPEVAGEACLLVDPQNTAEITAAISRLLSDQSLQQALIRKGLLNAERFTWQKTAEQVLSILEQVP
ncbi:MAG: glycosyltransferase family 1 protein [Candidatus Promineifilaceae bacterium]